MASGQSQGLVAWLIVAFVLMFIFAVTTFLGFNSYSGVLQELDDAKQAAREATQVEATLQRQIGEIAARVGYPEVGEPGSESDPPGADTLLGRMKQEIETHAGQADKTYKGAVAYLSQHIQDQIATIEKLQQQNQLLTDNLEKRTAETEALLSEVTEQNAQLLADNRQYTEAFDARNDELQQDLDNLTAQIRRVTDERDQMEIDMRTLEERYTEQMQNMQTLVDSLQARVRELEFVDLEMPDGKIRSIDRRIKSVYINLGKMDFLPEQISFSVYPHDAQTVGAEKPKAKIEVIRILEDEDHLAEARITEEELYDPIEPGDLIYNPGWNPGQQLRFALAGRFLIDEDSESDRDVIKALIRSYNGAVYDPENPIEGTCEVVALSGQILGEINHLTNYLVLGDPPQVEAGQVGAEQAGAIASELDAYNEVLAQARQYGVKVIPFRQFLDIVGYTAKRRLFQTGSERTYPREGGGTGMRESITSQYSRGRISSLYEPGFKSHMLPESRTPVNGMYMPGMQSFMLPSSRTPVSSVYMDGQTIQSSRSRVHGAYEGGTAVRREGEPDPAPTGRGATSGNGAATRP